MTQQRLYTCIGISFCNSYFDCTISFLDKYISDVERRWNILVTDTPNVKYSFNELNSLGYRFILSDNDKIWKRQPWKSLLVAITDCWIMRSLTKKRTCMMQMSRRDGGRTLDMVCYIFRRWTELAGATAGPLETEPPRTAGRRHRSAGGTQSTELLAYPWSIFYWILKI